MFINSIKKSAVAAMAAALMAVSVFPAFAGADNGKKFGAFFGNFSNGLFSFFSDNRLDIGEDNALRADGSLSFTNNDAVRTAQKAFRDAVKQANDAYKNARRTARDKFFNALSSAGNNSATRISAYKTYLTEILAAFRQRSSAKEAALQKLIDSLSNLPANQAPTANAQSVTLSKNVSKLITLTGSDPEGSALSFFVVANPAHGTLSGTVPNLTYLPATDYTGADSFTFKINDGTQDSATATVSITVNP